MQNKGIIFLPENYLFKYENQEVQEKNGKHWLLLQILQFLSDNNVLHITTVRIHNPVGFVFSQEVNINLFRFYKTWRSQETRSYCICKYPVMVLL